MSIEFPHSLPEWMEEIMDAINITDGIDEARWKLDPQGDYYITIEYGPELLEFQAGTDGESHGVQYDCGSIHDMTQRSQVQWWIAGELLSRLNALRQKYTEDMATMNQRLIDRREAFERKLSTVP